VVEAAILEGILDHAAEEGNVGPSTNLQELVGLRCGAGEARIDDDNFGVTIALGFHHPFETARMVFGWISAHDQHHVGVLDVDPAVGHGPASECWSQT